MTLSIQSKTKMYKFFYRLNLLLFFFYIIFTSQLKGEIIQKINIEGNQRISLETIKMFSGVSINDDLSKNDLNKILKKLYNTNFFDLVTVKIENEILLITVKENPIIQNLDYNGIKSSSILEDLKKNVILKPRSSYNQILLEKDKKNIKDVLKKKVYYFSKVEIFIDELEDNKINLTYEISEKKLKIKDFLYR